MFYKIRFQEAFISLILILLLAGCGREAPTPNPTDAPLLATETPVPAEPTSTEIPPTDTPAPVDAADAETPQEEDATVAEPTELPIEEPAAEEPAAEEPEDSTSAAAEAAADPATDSEEGSESTTQPTEETRETGQSGETSVTSESVETGDEDIMNVADLAIGTPGRYVNVAYGYIANYPEDWFTGFGNRPILASFSNLDPGTTNRDVMRSTGCLFETNIAPNVYGSTLSTMIAQLPQTYANAELLELDGVEAVRLGMDNPNVPFVREIIQTVVDGRQVTITGEMARTALDTCQPVWSDFLNNWSWFTPNFVTYRNTEFGYSFSHPRSWVVSVISDRGEVVSSQEALSEVSLEDLANDGMVVHTDVLENPDVLTLKQWLVANVSNPGLTNDIFIESLIGVRSVTDWPDGTQKMIGYFQGPLGKIYAVSCTYPAERRLEFRPIANAILYSFGF